MSHCIRITCTCMTTCYRSRIESDKTKEPGCDLPSETQKFLLRS